MKRSKQTVAVLRDGYVYSGRRKVGDIHIKKGGANQLLVGMVQPDGKVMYWPMNIPDEVIPFMFVEFSISPIDTPFTNYIERP